MEIQVAARWRCADRHTETDAGVVERDVLIADGDTGICIVEAHRHRFRDAYGCS